MGNLLSTFWNSGQALPSIKLDTTLAELYHRDRIDDKHPSIGLVAVAVNSEMNMNSQIPRNTKYVYIDSTFNNTTENPSSNKYRDLQRKAAVKYLSLVPQHEAFVAGKMKVIICNIDERDRKTRHSQEETALAMSQIHETQRPELVFLNSPKEILPEKIGVDKLSTKLGLDDLEGYPMTVDLDTHYYLNTKAALALSGLPTPRCRFIELEGTMPEVQSCCELCRSSSSNPGIPRECAGVRRQWLSSQVSRITGIVAEHPIPYVFKNNQSFAGGGTIVVSTEDERETLLHDLTSHMLPKLLALVDTKNAHLKPATILLSDMIIDPIGDYGLTFFVTQTGHCVFISVSEQFVDSKKAWIGSRISYPAQEKLEKRFGDIMHQIGSWLHKNKYYGPVGADILETVDETGGQATCHFHIVDLNVRTSGSLALGLLSNHFYRERGLKEASQFSINARMTRDEFIHELGSDYLERSIVIDSWIEDEEQGVSYAKVIIGAKNKEELEQKVAWVKEHGSEMKY
jgi:hypothetical protein